MPVLQITFVIRVINTAPSQKRGNTRQTMAREQKGFEILLNKKPTIDELCEHVRIDTNWYVFGILLGLDTTKLDSIRVMNEDNSFKAIKMFELWLSSNPNATRREIIETLRKEAIGKNAIAEN